MKLRIIEDGFVLPFVATVANGPMLTGTYRPATPAVVDAYRTALAVAHPGTDREKVRAELDSSMPDGAARVSIRLASGEIVTETVMSPRGSLADPLGDRDIEAKLRDGVRTGGSNWNAERIIEAVWQLETCDDIAALMHRARAGPAPRAASNQSSHSNALQT